MTDLLDLSNHILKLSEANERLIVAIAGSPGSGKSTLVSNLQKLLDGSFVVPMDGFHLDNQVLSVHSMLDRKGSAASFDSVGYYELLKRIRHSGEVVYAPVFDRDADLSKAGAIEIPKDAKIILTEGNYLLLDQTPWNQLAPLFDLTVFLDIDESILRERLVKRWLEQGLSNNDAVKRAESNDLINAKQVSQYSRTADIVLQKF